MPISFRDIPGKSTPLFSDYLYDFSRTSGFYAGDFRDDDTGRRILSSVSSKPWLNRPVLADVLQKQNRAFGNTNKTAEQIERLRDTRTVAVVTGQQMGLFGGPLYTLYKAMGTVKLCELYQKRFHEFQFVPVFWMELEDHDFEEIRSIQLINAENEIRLLSYSGTDPENKDKCPINAIGISEDIGRLMQEVRAVLQTTDFTQEILAPLESAYQSGKSVSGAFGQWMAFLMGKYGLILMDPSDSAFKKMAGPVFQKELENTETIHERLKAQSGAVKAAGYEPQVDIEPTNLFMRDSGGVRHVLNKNGFNKFKIKSEDAKSHRAELLRLAETEPARYIPNVVLRPIVQDYLLPTFAYVGGPSEIAYFAQFKPIYEFFGIPEPLVVPRPFVTVLEKKIKKALDKYGLTIEEVFAKQESVVHEIASRNSDRSMTGEWEKLMGDIKNRFSQFEKDLISVDASLKGASETALDKIEKAVKVLSDKTAEAEKRRNELTHSQLGKAVRHLFPNGQFQEREINALYYLNKYGLGFLDAVYENMDVSGVGHQIVEM